VPKPLIEGATQWLAEWVIPSLRFDQFSPINVTHATVDSPVYGLKLGTLQRPQTGRAWPEGGKDTWV
jgi:hypothetical protein